MQNKLLCPDYYVNCAAVPDNITGPDVISFIEEITLLCPNYHVNCAAVPDNKTGPDVISFIEEITSKAMH